MKIIIAVMVFLIQSFGIFAQIQNRQITGQSFKGTISINASAEKVWNALTNIKKFAAIHETKYTSKSQKLEKIGDSFRMNAMGDPGLVLLSYINKGKEIRLTWEPDNGSYLCQERWTITPKGNSTDVNYEERYTESSKQSPEDISSQIKNYNNMLLKLKSETEGK